MPARASCTICIDNYPIDKFRVYSCGVSIGRLYDILFNGASTGHCFCDKCVSALTKQKITKCPVCRKPISPRSGEQLYLDIFESSVEKAEWVTEGVKRMGVDTETKSVQRAKKEIEKVIDDNGFKRNVILVSCLLPFPPIVTGR
jgi:hypothetical protein